jgi:hypothetical protein
LAGTIDLEQGLSRTYDSFQKNRLKHHARFPQSRPHHRITGQDGSYLQNFFLKKDMLFMALNASQFLQHPTHRPPLSGSTRRNLRFRLHYGDLTDTGNLIRIIRKSSPTKSTIWRHRAMLR